MRLLIDTHAFLWFCEGNPALSSAARSAMQDTSNERYVSHATAWEIAIKLNLGKLRLQVGYDVIFPGVLHANSFRLLAPAIRHYQSLIALPRHHGDPFDRLLIAQAQSEGLSIVTCDSAFQPYGLPIVW